MFRSLAEVNELKRPSQRTAASERVANRGRYFMVTDMAEDRKGDGLKREIRVSRKEEGRRRKAYIRFGIGLRTNMHPHERLIGCVPV